MRLSYAQCNPRDVLVCSALRLPKKIIMNGLYEPGIVQRLLILSQRDRQLLIIRGRDANERDVSESAAPPINVNDLFLQRTSRHITVSYVIAPVFFVYVRACCFSFRLTRLISNKRKTTCQGYSGTDLSSILRSLSDTFVLFPLQVTLTSVFYSKQLRLYFFENLEQFNNSLYVYILYIFSKRLKQNKFNIIIYIIL